MMKTGAAIGSTLIFKRNFFFKSQSFVKRNKSSTQLKGCLLMTILLTNMLMVDVDGQKFVWKILYLLNVSPRSQMREHEVKGHSDKASGMQLCKAKIPSQLPLTLDRTPKIFPFHNYFYLNAKINLPKQKHEHQTAITAYCVTSRS